MLAPPRKILWAHHLPIPNNPFPLYSIHNYSLGRSAKSIALFVPLSRPYHPFEDLKKQQGENSLYGPDRGLLIPQDLKGHGDVASAFQHPIKVPTYFSTIC